VPHQATLVQVTIRGRSVTGSVCGTSHLLDDYQRHPMQVNTTARPEPSSIMRIGGPLALNAATRPHLGHGPP
jgi:hypothetical protein